MNAFLFVPLLAMTWICGMFLSMLASRYFLGVMESSAAGHEEVELTAEPFVDWMLKVVYLGFFVVIWSVPSLIIGGNTRQPPMVAFFLVLLPFWLLFPIGILSPMSLQARWVPFTPELLGRMARRSSATFQFYFLSLPVLLGFGYSFWTATRPSESLAVVLFAPVAAATFLIYARLLGRLGLVLSFAGKVQDDVKPVKKKKKKRPKPIIEDAENVQPSQMKGVQTPYDGELVGYDVNFGGELAPEPEPTPTRRPDRDEDDGEPEYVMDEVVEDVEVENTNLINPERQRRAFEPSKYEMDLISAEQIEEPKKPFGASAIQFLAAPQMIMAFLRLSGFILLFATLIHAMGALRPG